MDSAATPLETEANQVSKPTIDEEFRRLIPKLNEALKRSPEATHPDTAAGAHNSNLGQ